MEAVIKAAITMFLCLITDLGINQNQFENIVYCGNSLKLQ